MEKGKENDTAEKGRKTRRVGEREREGDLKPASARGRRDARVASAYRSYRKGLLQPALDCSWYD